MEKLLTVAIPTYNREVLLKRTLNSIKNQDLNKVEILVVDNASTDSTENMIKEEFPFVRYIKNETNIGPDNNFLKCYREASGKYIWLLGSDDLILPNGIETVIDFIKNNDNLNLFFVNYTTFIKNSNNENKMSEQSTFNVNTGTLITTDKNIIMQYVQSYLSYMSSFVIKKDSFSKVKNPEKYVQTSFIHSCIAFEVSVGKTEIGIIFTPCIAQDLTFENSEMSKKQNLNMLFTVMIKRLYHLMIEVAPDFGYDIKTMKKYYYKYINDNFPKTVLSLKAQQIPMWKDAFFKEGYPYIKNSVVSWVKIILPAVFAPEFLLKKVWHKKHGE